MGADVFHVKHPVQIAYVINSLEGGGAALPLPDIAAALAQAGANVRVLALTLRDGRALEPLRRAGVPVEVRDGGERDHAAALRWLWRRLAAEPTDAVWTSLTRATLLGQLAGRAKKLPVVSWQHNAFLKPANRRLLRATAGLSSLWVADSDAVARLTAERLGVPDGRLVTWPIFAAGADARQAQPWRPGEPLRLGSLGRLHPAKGYDALLAAFASLHADGWAPPVPLRLTIAGEGAERDALAGQAADAGMALELPGFTADPAGFLATQHLYLQPSRREGFGIATHQAMAAGLPVLASMTGEMATTLLDRATGRLVPVGDVRALASALRELLSAPDELAAMGTAGRDRVLALYGRAAFDARGAAALDRLRALKGWSAPPGQKPTRSPPSRTRP